MKKFLILSLTALFSISCSNSASTRVNTNSANSTTTTASTPKKDNLTVRSHETGSQPTSTNPSNSGSGGSPMQKPVDVTELTANIEKAEKEYKAKPGDAKAKEELAAAYFGRAFVLTKAAQYRAAVGDFRKGLKLNPDDGEAKAMYDQILQIFKSIGREPPKEGEEPPPMPVEKSK